MYAIRSHRQVQKAAANAGWALRATVCGGRGGQWRGHLSQLIAQRPSPTPMPILYQQRAFSTEKPPGSPHEDSGKEEQRAHPKDDQSEGVPNPKEYDMHAERLERDDLQRAAARDKHNMHATHPEHMKFDKSKGSTPGPESLKSGAYKTIETAAHYAEEMEKSYKSIEHSVMKRIHESNTRRFRIGLMSTILLIVWVIAMFGDRIRKKLTRETASLAKETLENESLKIQTQELAMAVVQTVLNDKDVTANAASFLREASSAPETQQALLQLTLHVLQHPDSLKELVELGKKLVAALVEDEETVGQFALLLSESLKVPILQAAVAKLLADLSEDPEVIETLSRLLVAISKQKDVTDGAETLLSASADSVLHDDKIVNQSREFVADVMRDAALQREGGDALWNSVTHALKPGMIRLAGFSIVVASIGLASIVLRPY